MSKFFLYGGILGGAILLTLIGFLWWQNQNLNTENDQLKTELTTALGAIEIQNKTIEENERQQQIVNRNIQQLNRQLSEIERRERALPAPSDDASIEEINNFMKSLNDRLEKVTQ